MIKCWLYYALVYLFINLRLCGRESIRIEQILGKLQFLIIFEQIDRAEFVNGIFLSFQIGILADKNRLIVQMCFLSTKMAILFCLFKMKNE